MNAKHVDMPNMDISSAVADKKRVECRFNRALGTYGNHATVQASMAKILVDMALPFVRERSQMLEIGCGAGALTSEILNRFKPDRFVANDLAPSSAKYIKPLADACGIAHFSFLPGDAERVEFQSGYDMVWSGATLQWLSDKAEFFSKISKALNAHGLFVFSTFGPGNFEEMKMASGIGLDYHSACELVGMLSSDFEVLDTVQWTETMWFEHPINVLRHIQCTGVGGASSKQWGKAQFSRFCSNYSLLRHSPMGYPLTYNPMLFVCRK